MKPVVFTFGRFNPPTIGHEKLVKKVFEIARQQGAEPRVYLSHSKDRKKNPLDYAAKLKFAQSAFGSVVKRSGLKTIIQLLKRIERDGVTQVTFVVGSDRVTEFRKLLNTYNGRDFNFENIFVASAGERDPDADGVSGMSATKMRDAARQNNYDTFKSGCPSGMSDGDCKKMFNTLKTILEEIELENYIEEGIELNEIRNPHPMRSERIVNKPGHDWNGKKVTVIRGARHKWKKGIHSVTPSDNSTLAADHFKSHELVKESVEIDELSEPTLRSYIKKSSADIDKRFAAHPETEKDKNKLAKRVRGYAKAGIRVGVNSMKESEVQRADFRMEKYTDPVTGKIKLRKYKPKFKVEEYEWLIDDITESPFFEVELEEALNEIDNDEVVEINEVLNLQQRIKKSRIMRRLAPRFKRLRQIKRKRIAPKERLQKRARAAGKQMVRKRLAGKMGANYANLTASQKIAVDKIVEKKKGIIDRLSRRLLPTVRKKEIARVRMARKSK